MIKYFLILSLTGCSYFIKLDQVKNNPEIKVKKDEKPFCSESKFQFASENHGLISSLNPFLRKQVKFRKPVEVFVLQVLAHLKYDPFYFNPKSKIQIFSLGNSYQESYAFANKDNNLTIALSKLLARYGSRSSLIYFASYLDRNFTYRPVVDEKLARFLRDNKEQVKLNKKLRDYYFRGNQPLRTGEVLPFLSAKRIVSKYKPLRRKNSNKVNLQKVTYRNMTLFCNYSLRTNKNYYSKNSSNLKSTYVAALFPKQSFIAAVAFAPKAKSLGYGPYFSHQSETRAAKFCVLKDKTKKIALVSTNSSDPSQHIKHLLDNNITSARSAHKTSSFIEHARHQFKTDPTRIFIESNRTTNQQLEELLKLNFPFYHATTLGKVWAWYQNKEQSLIIDSRQKGSLQCL